MKKIIFIVLFFVLLLVICMRLDGEWRWKCYVRYYFYDYKDQNELIERVKNFKKENPQYDMFVTDSLNHLISVDSAYSLMHIKQGSNDIDYHFDLYLPHNQSAVSCFIRPYVKEYNNNDKSIYVLSYENIPLEVKDSMSEDYYFINNQIYLIDRRDGIEKDARARLNELYEILDNFGKYKKIE